MNSDLTVSGKPLAGEPPSGNPSGGEPVPTQRTTPRSLGSRLVEVLLRRGFDETTPRWAAGIAIAAALAGAALIVTTAAIHLHLWLSGYRHVPRLGPLFLAQAITGLLLGPIVALSRQALLLLSGAGFMAASAVGLILSATVGFVGIHDGLDVPWATPALAVEIAGFLVLSASSAIALAPLVRRSA
jgi:hypothetical protein